MTCAYSVADWRDVLYNAIRKSPGGVASAAGFLTERRGRTIHPETLRARLRAVDGESISMEMAELLTEYMLDLNRPDALEWLHKLNGRFDIASATISLDEKAAVAVGEIRDKLLHLNVFGGRLTEMGMRATSDGEIDPAEADELESQALSEIRMLFQLIRKTRTASQLGAKGGAA